MVILATCKWFYISYKIETIFFREKKSLIRPQFYVTFQEIRLGLHRSDYMLDIATGKLLQVELNTISSSFAGLGCLVSQLHRLVNWCEMDKEMLMFMSNLMPIPSSQIPFQSQNLGLHLDSQVLFSFIMISRFVAFIRRHFLLKIIIVEI